MSHFPSFIHEINRPGSEADDNAEVLNSNRGKLLQLIYGALREAEASYMMIGVGGAEDERTLGDATLVHALREDRPITPEEARQLGDGIVARWMAMKEVDDIPEFCDSVLTLPEQA